MKRKCIPKSPATELSSYLLMTPAEMKEMLKLVPGSPFFEYLGIEWLRRTVEQQPGRTSRKYHQLRAVEILAKVLQEEGKGNADIRDITVDDIEKVQARLVALGFKPRSILYCLTTLQTLFDSAVKQALIAYNPVQRAQRL